ncbi:hypothetical protein PIB30_032523 [Stylosanthes scabra]|uniref:Exonuclease 1 n=1 Tax=Stylosanthes scabra TaxID=79078 RepID=A0ABU6XAC0_9FABA|nr:hypothetical protein [Stylosanthes scabra]
MELCLDSDSEKKLRYIEYFMHRVNLLRYYKITPVVVFDGGNVPCKGATEQERHKKRSANRELAMAKLKEGNVVAASELFQRAVNITPMMAYQLIQTLRSESIEFVVAPYEADAQLAYMSNLEVEKGGITAVITEDSDLIAYGCPAIIFKMDREGNGERIEIEKVFSAKSTRPSFRKFDMKHFTGMCVLAGCDFLPSVPGIGIARAHALVSKYQNLDRVMTVLKFEKGDQMPEDYAKSFKEAIAVFQHARIYDPNAKELKHMKPLPQGFLKSLDGTLDFLGPEIPSTIVTAIAEGDLNPLTKEAFDKSESPALSLNRVAVKRIGQTKKVEVPKQVTKENCFSVFVSQNTIENNTDKSSKLENHLYSAVTKEEFVSDIEKHSGEELALEKLIMPLETNEALEKTIISDDTPLKVPNNNPFKIMRTEETSFSVQTDDKTTSEKVSVASNVEYIDLCTPPDSFEEEKESQNLPRKRKFQNICSDKPVSGVTQEEPDSDVICLNVESQGSVNSKTSKKNGAGLKGRCGSEKQSKKGKFKQALAGNRTILNFFSRV